MSVKDDNPFKKTTPSGPDNGRGTGDGSGLDQKSGLGDIKARIHKRLIERLNLASLETIERDQAVAAIRQVIQELLAQEAFALNLDERENPVALERLFPVTV